MPLKELEAHAANRVSWRKVLYKAVENHERLSEKSKAFDETNKKTSSRTMHHSHVSTANDPVDSELHSIAKIY